MEAAEAQSITIVEGLKNSVSKGMTRMHEMVVFTPTHLLAILLAEKKWGEQVGVPFPIEKIFIRPDVFAIIKNNPAKYSEVSRAMHPWLFSGKIGLKLFADGSFVTYTAAVSTPYSDLRTRGAIFDTLERARRAIELVRPI